MKKVLFTLLAFSMVSTTGFSFGTANCKDSNGFTEKYFCCSVSDKITMSSLIWVNYSDSSSGKCSDAPKFLGSGTLSGGKGMCDYNDGIYKINQNNSYSYSNTDTLYTRYNPIDTNCTLGS